ncbi:type II secretion system protein GspM [Xanthobacter sp. KR7-65]|uniref:type II secretion system protein GspM n=1 Tax=Xanthobacter sp. KR7-65 TaxID=3156612 RepID=UPI0032B5658E
MTMPASPTSRGARRDLRPMLAALAYAAVVLALLGVAASTVADLMDRRAAVAEAADRLDRLQGRRPGGGPPTGTAQDGSPFLEGPSLTIAGADLLQRVTTAIARYDGRLTSSRVEVQSTRYGADFVAVTADLDISQTDLQKLLYDLEAGMPFLFVGQLAVQAQARGEGGDDERVRVTLTVYGQWQKSP